jgi:hypothetical protein
VTSTAPAGGTRRRRPLYARLLRLRYLHPGGVACFLLFEGTIVLGLLLALSELVDWQVVVLLPAGVAVMVKLNDLLAGTALHRLVRGRPGPVARGTAVVVDPPPVPVRRRAVGTAPAPGVPAGPGGAVPAEPDGGPSLGGAAPRTGDAQA